MRRIRRWETVMGTTAVAATAAATLVATLSSASGASTTRISAASGQANAVAAAKAFVKAHETFNTTWPGPTTGPTAQAGKSVVVVVSELSNPAAVDYADAIKAAGKSIGWKVTVLDGQGTQSGWVDGLNAAIADHPNGIVTDITASSVQPELKEAAKAGIDVVGIHSDTQAGPYPQYHEFYNEQTVTAQIGKAIADYAIAASNGHARVVILYDDLYAVARQKALVMKQTIESCPGCKVLAYVTSPTADDQTDLPALATRWWADYGKGTYVLTVGDNNLDYIAPALKSIGVPANGMPLVGSDGIPAAYQRIRTGQYQVATVPEPWGLFGWQAIDELNRDFHHMRPDAFSPPVFIVTKANVNAQGGNKDEFIPAYQYETHYDNIWKYGTYNHK